MISDKWDRRFLDLAQHIAGWSKDRSTQTGAVIVDHDRRIVSCGYNGFARGVNDFAGRYENRELKLMAILHCEENAILFAGGRCDGHTLYTWPFSSCSKCASIVIQSGITRCVAPVTPKAILARWKDSLKLARQMFREAGVQLDLLPETR